MLPYMTATKPYYFPVVIIPVLIGAVSLAVNLKMDIRSATLPMLLVTFVRVAR